MERVGREVLISEPEGFSAKAVELLRRAGFRPVLNEGGLSEIAGLLPGKEGLIVRFGVHWGRELLARGAALRFIATPATGVGHIDVEAAGEAGIEVISLEGLEGLEEVSSTAEHAFGLLLALVRHTCCAHRSVLAGRWHRDAFIGRELRGKTAGVIGLGRLGKMFARMADIFGMGVVYYDPHVDSKEYVRCRSLEELAAASDFVSLHVKLTPQTRGMITAGFFSACKRGMCLVNTSRGELVDEESLLQALESGVLSGAALDVLCDEPEEEGAFPSPVIEYARQNSNVIVTPHIGGATSDAMRRTEEMIVGEVIRRFGHGGGRAK